MSCIIHGKLDTALEAVKEAFKEAVDTKDFDRESLTDLWECYQSIQTIVDGMPVHSHTELGDIKIDLDEDLSDVIGGYNMDLYTNDPLAGTVTFPTEAPATPSSVE